MSKTPREPTAPDPIVVRHFRQVVLWPLQLVVPERTTSTIQRAWEGLSDVTTGNPWSEVPDEFQSNPERFEARPDTRIRVSLPSSRLRNRNGSRTFSTRSPTSGSPGATSGVCSRNKDSDPFVAPGTTGPGITESNFRAPASPLA
jgi:hypothetical protein